MRVLLVSTYELGHQPLHLASPAAALVRAGHEVRCADLALEPLDATTVAWADAVACSVPMHTAMRMARTVCAGIREQAPDVPICLFGLYAVLDGAEGADPVADVAIAGEYEPALVSWVDGGAPRTTPGPTHTPVAVELGRSHSLLPARRELAPLGRYARLAIGDEERLAGYVEASHGCAHRCRHCPVPVVYDGRTRIVDADAVVADVAQLVEAGARHITFGDPDFLNGPHHARRVLAAVHGAFPGLTFDVTVKVEHILAHPAIWPEFAAAGVVFVVSAFESASNTVLDLLDKGHRADDEVEAVRILRAAGIEPRPSLMPFTPWSTADDILDLLDLVARCDLAGNVDPVQYSIRLLVPAGSLLISSGALDGRLDAYDAEHLGWSWRSPDRRLDALQLELAGLATVAAARQWPAERAYHEVRARAVDALDPTGKRAGAPASDPRLRSATAPGARPRLTESWFCCAEPTALQMATSEITSPITDTRCLVP